MCHFEGLHVRDGGVVPAKLAVEATNSAKDVAVCRSKLVKGCRSKVLCHTFLQQDINHSGYQRSYLMAKRGGRLIVQLRAEPLGRVRKRQVLPSMFKRGFDIFLDNVAYIQELDSLFISRSRCSDD